MSDPEEPGPEGEDLLANSDLVTWLRRHVDGQPVATESVQTLWSGYGEVVRVRLAGATVPSVIVKRVTPPAHRHHPRGWSGETSHRRKLRSYEVERCFYTDWCPTPTSGFRTATCHAAEKTADGWRFLLEDLDAASYAGRRQRLETDERHRCLRWLAAFHARFLGRPPTGLWEVGTYWHLATRTEELEALEDGELRAAATPLDAALNDARFRTLVHGDAKVANFCFADDDVAAVDFQYVGGGCGMKDVAYFLSSFLADGECETQAPTLLDTYFGHLRDHLSADVDADALEEEWRGLYPAAWADFHRFLEGWAPGHWKIHRYTREMTRRALQTLKR